MPGFQHPQEVEVEGETIDRYIVEGKAIYYVSRDVWCDGLPVQSGSARPLEDFEGLVVHHTVGYAKGSALSDKIAYMQYLQGGARPDLGPEVPYSFVVFGDANPDVAWVCEGRGLGRTGAHTKGHNYDRYGCAWAGNSNNDPINDAVVNAYRLLKSWSAETAPTTGHRDWAATACPGSNLYARLSEIDVPISSEGISSMYMVKLPNGKFDVVLPGIGHNPEINDPAHWAQVIQAGNASGLYESPYMAALMDDRFEWEDDNNSPPLDLAGLRTLMDRPSPFADDVANIVGSMREDIAALKEIVTEIRAAIPPPKTYTRKVQ
jgi:hypothetical protein